MTDKTNEYRIVDDEPPKIRFRGGGIKVVVKSVTATVSNTDPDRDVTKFFKDANGRCLICELPCSKDDCTECRVPGFSGRITAQVMDSITSHRSHPMAKTERTQ